MKFSLRAVADVLGASLPQGPDMIVTGWSVDSRTVQPGIRSLADQFTLHLRQCGEYMEKEPACWRGRVDPLGDRPKVDPALA